MKSKKAILVLLMVGMLSACGNSQEKKLASDCKKNSGLSDSICECTAKKFVAAVSDDGMKLFMDVRNGLSDFGNSDQSNDPFGQMQRAQDRLQKIAKDHEMSILELQSRLKPIGQQLDSAQSACMQNL